MSLRRAILTVLVRGCAACFMQAQTATANDLKDVTHSGNNASSTLIRQGDSANDTPGRAQQTARLSGYTLQNGHDPEPRSNSQQSPLESDQLTLAVFELNAPPNLLTEAQNRHLSEAMRSALSLLLQRSGVIVLSQANLDATYSLKDRIESLSKPENLVAAGQRLKIDYVVGGQIDRINPNLTTPHSDI